MNHSALTACARHAALTVLLTTMLPAAQVAAQATGGAPRTLSLDDAFRLAEPASDDVRIAQNAVTRSKGQYYQARATVLPQLTATANYQNLIQNQFEAILRRFAPPPDPTAPIDPAPVPFNPLAAVFGAQNTIVFGLQASQPLYIDGRFALAGRVAKANEDATRFGLRTARAKLRYDIASAYFDALIAEKLVQIAESSLVQVRRTFQQTSLQRQVGTVAEFDLLRARVAVDAQRPLVIQATQNRDVTTLILKQLLNLPLTVPIALVTPIQDADMENALTVSKLGGDVRPSAGSGLSNGDIMVMPNLNPRDTTPGARTAVQQAQAVLEVQKGALRNAELSRVPVLNLSSNYARTAFQGNANPIPTTLGAFFPQWTVSLGFSVPIITSGRIKGDQMVARANVADAEARLSQGERAAALDVQLALRSLEQAQANWLASIGTEEQADKALRIADVRYVNGISTQLELSDIRYLLIQSQANRLTAARDLQLARLRLTLLRDLPLGSGDGTFTGPGAASQQLQQQLQQQPGGSAGQGGALGAPRPGTSASVTGTSGRPQ